MDVEAWSCEMYFKQHQSATICISKIEIERSQVNKGAVIRCSHCQLHLIFLQPRIECPLPNVAVVSRVELGHRLLHDHFLNLLLSSHIADHFAHEIELVLVEKLEMRNIQHLRLLFDERIDSLAWVHFFRKNFISSLLKQSNGVGVNFIQILKLVQIVFFVLQQLLLERRLKEQVVVIVLWSSILGR